MQQTWSWISHVHTNIPMPRFIARALIRWFMRHKDLVKQRQLLNFTALAWRWPGNFLFGTQVSKQTGNSQQKKKKKVCSFLGLEERIWWWLREGKGKGLWEKDQKLQNKQQMREGGESYEIKIEKWFTREKTQVRGKTKEWLRRRKTKHRGKERKKRHSWSSAWKESTREAIQSSVTLDERTLQISASPLHLWVSFSRSLLNQGPQTIILHNSTMRNAKVRFLILSL